MGLNAPELSIRNAEIGYRFPLLGGLTLYTSGSGICAVIGRNGIGKTTLLKTIAGLLPALKGEFRLNGRPLQNYPLSERAKEVSILLGRSSSDREISVAELVLLGRTPYRNLWDHPLPDDWEKLAFYLDLMGITDLRDRSCQELSDGQYQKVLLARTLIQECPLVLLDEPTVHLDPYQRLLFFESLHQLSTTRKIRFVLSTHEIDLAWRFSDVWWMLDGKENRQLEVSSGSKRPDIRDLYSI